MRTKVKLMLTIDMRFKSLLLSLILLPAISFSQVKISSDEAVRIAETNNQRVRSLQFGIQKEEAIKTASVNIPKLKLFVEYEGIKNSLSDFENRKIGLSQDFEFPSVYGFRSSVQEYQVQIARRELESYLNELRTEVKLNYAALDFQSRRLAIITEALQFNDEFVRIASRRLDEGDGTTLELLSVRVNRIRIENELKNIQSEILNARTQLRTLLNVDYEPEPSGEFIAQKINISRVQAVNSALANNPDIQLASLRKTQSDERISLARSEALPDFSLTYYNQKIGNQSGYYGFEIGVGIPLWFFWTQSGNIEQAKFERNITGTEETIQRRSVEAEVTVAYQNYETSLRQLDFFSSGALAESEEILRASRRSYEEGAIGYLEYLQALNIVNETKTQYINALYNYNQSVIKLERLIGRNIK